MHWQRPALRRAKRRPSLFKLSYLNKTRECSIGYHNLVVVAFQSRDRSYYSPVCWCTNVVFVCVFSSLKHGHSLLWWRVWMLHNAPSMLKAKGSWGRHMYCKINNTVVSKPCIVRLMRLTTTMYSAHLIPTDKWWAPKWAIQGSKAPSLETWFFQTNSLLRHRRIQ